MQVDSFLNLNGRPGPVSVCFLSRNVSFIINSMPEKKTQFEINMFEIRKRKNIKGSMIEKKTL